MTEADVLELLDRLDTAGIEWWIDGGWGIDALLGEQTREHGDLDLAVRREDIHRLAGVFPDFTRTNEHEWPSAYVLVDGRGRRLDFHPLEVDERGDGRQAAFGGGTNLWPREALAARGRIGDREVRCTSVEFQLESHQFPAYDDIDFGDMKTLCVRFGVDMPAGLTRPGFLHARRRRT